MQPEESTGAVTALVGAKPPPHSLLTMTQHKAATPMDRYLPTALQLSNTTQMDARSKCMTAEALTVGLRPAMWTTIQPRYCHTAAASSLLHHALGTPLMVKVAHDVLAAKHEYYRMPAHALQVALGVCLSCSSDMHVAA